MPATLVGINDSPALAKADVGIAMGTGTYVAIGSAQVRLVKGDLRGILHALELSGLPVVNMRQNLGFAFLYNAIGVHRRGRSLPLHRLAPVANDRRGNHEF